jgi:hypothetical protein
LILWRARGPRKPPRWPPVSALSRPHRSRESGCARHCTIRRTPPLSRQSLDDSLVEIVDDGFVIVSQLADDISASAVEADQSDLHAALPRSLVGIMPRCSHLSSWRSRGSARQTRWGDRSGSFFHLPRCRRIPFSDRTPHSPCRWRVDAGFFPSPRRGCAAPPSFVRTARCKAKRN